MKKTEQVFLSVLKAALSGKLPEDPGLNDDQWTEVLHLSDEHDILPLLFEAVISMPASRNAANSFKNAAAGKALRQITQTNEFLTLLLRAQARGLDPIVLKGITVRSLYPKPYLRPSVDEDILVPRTQAQAFYEFLLSEGLTADDPSLSPETEYEISFHKPNSPTYIEMHLSLFDPSSSAYGELNDLFTGIEERTVRQQIEDVSVRTLHPTDHLLYLICHAYKHFLHSGVGIRQMADIGIFSSAHEQEIGWEYVEEACRKAGIESFAAAVFKIIRKYLVPELQMEKSSVISRAGGVTHTETAFSTVRIDEGPLLEDALKGGIYGLSAPERVNSVNMTLSAAEAAKKGKKSAHGVLKSIFPGKDYLQRCFPYAKAHPILVPAAWANRIMNYVKRTPKVLTSTAKTIRAGRKRTALLKKYKITDR